jgi:hypothetical protein
MKKTILILSMDKYTKDLLKIGFGILEYLYCGE